MCRAILPDRYRLYNNTYDNFFASTSMREEVQFGQRVASILISDIQYGHFLVVGAAGFSGSGLRSLFKNFTIQNTTSAIMIKLITLEIKEPYLNTAAPAFSSAASVS